MFRLVKRLDKVHEDSVWCIQWTAQNMILTSSVDETVKVLSPPTAETKDAAEVVRHSFSKHDLGVVSVSASADGHTAVSSSMDGHLRQFDLTHLTEKAKIEAGPVEIWQVSVHPTRSQICATGSHSGNVNVWNFDTGARVDTAKPGNKFTMAVAYSPNGKYLASAHHDGSVNLVDAETNKPVSKMPAAHARAVRNICFSPDSRTLMCASEDMHVSQFEVESATHIALLSGHTSWVTSVAFSPTDHTFASGSCDKRVKVWDARTRECLNTYEDQADQIWSITYSPDGKNIVSGAEDGAVCMYEVQRGAQI